MRESTYGSSPGLGQNVLTHYLAQKLENNKLSKKTAATWAKREGGNFYLVNEKYNSINYLGQLIPLNTQTTLKDGYWDGKKITGPNSATHQIQIPVLNGRDTMEAHFYTEDGTEYMEMSSFLYVSESNVKPLYTGQLSKVTLQKNGHAKWFTVPQEAAGKTMTVELPPKSSFAVYDEKGVCVNFTIVSDNNKVKLPENGTVVFVGEQSSEFTIKFN
ncbi:hypothetical protein IGW_05371 [Bacillus cereus ISP3191]|nr:hypothetical protein IGW_05371 [Bacillus cereus ISP3191]